MTLTLEPCAVGLPGADVARLLIGGDFGGGTGEPPRPSAKRLRELRAEVVRTLRRDLLRDEAEARRLRALAEAAEARAAIMRAWLERQEDLP